MRLLRLRDVESGPNDRVFRHPSMRALLVWLAVFCAVAAMFLYALVCRRRFIRYDLHF